MNDYVGEELADYIANYVNELVMTGKTVDKFAIMGLMLPMWLLNRIW